MQHYFDRLKRLLADEDWFAADHLLLGAMGVGVHGNDLKTFEAICRPFSDRLTEYPDLLKMIQRETD